MSKSRGRSQHNESGNRADRAGTHGSNPHVESCAVKIAQQGGISQVSVPRCGSMPELVLCAVPVMTMASSLAHAAKTDFRVRKAERGDIDALIELEHRVFAIDRLSRRSLQRFLQSPNAEVLVAQENAHLVGTAIVLFRRRSLVARLYSIAVAPHAGGRGVAPTLLEAAESAAMARDCRVMRLEVHHTNHAAISR